MSRFCAKPLLVFLVLACFLSCQCQRPPRQVKRTRTYMGTLVEITALGRDRGRLNAAVDAAFAEIARIEHLMSSFRDDSDVARINASAGGKPVVVDPEVYLVIARSKQVSELTGGAFDVTVAALKGLWSMNPEHPRVATAGEIAKRLPLISWRGLILDADKHAVGLARPGMRIDLGGIAKGYAVDRALAVLAAKGVTMALVNAGGDLRALGGHGRRPWHVGIQDPRRHDRLMGWLPVSDLAVATSGDYEKFIKIGGKRYCHIINPETGAPADACQSVTIIARETWRADALATAVFVMGPGRGMALVEKTGGVEALIIDHEGGIAQSSGLKGRVTWLERQDRH